MPLPIRLRRAAAAAALLAVLAAGAGCAGRRAAPCPPFESLAGPARADSLGLDAFLDLDPDRQAVRRAEAARYRARAGSAADVRGRAEALMSAAGLAPDDPDTWLRLARLWRWAGDYLQAEGCLDAASAAVRAAADGAAPLGRGAQQDAALRLAVLRAWLHYDRAEWREGMAWARAAGDLKAGDREVWRIQGLLAGALGRRSEAHEIADDIRRKDLFSSDITWILAVLDRGRGQDRAAFDQLLNINTGDRTVAELRPDRERAAECYRDMGAIAERVEEWAWARRWYEKSRAAVPLGRRDCIGETSAPRLGPAGRTPELPVWLAFGRWYVTGSLSSYANLALDRFENAATEAEREFWAGAAVNATGIVLRRGEDRAWALRARGLVFAARGDAPRGLADLRRASSLLAARGLGDARVEAGIGRLLLLRENHDGARPRLEEAVRLDPELAPAWADLGLAQVMTGDNDAARASFARALDLDPDLVTAWYNRGLMHLHAGDLEAAAADLAEAARLAPGNAEVVRLLQQVTNRLQQRGRQSRSGAAD